LNHRRTDAPVENGVGMTQTSRRCFVICDDLLRLGIIVSLIFFIIEKTNRLLRFHAMQDYYSARLDHVGIAFKILSMLVDIAWDTVGFMAFWGLL